MFKDKEKIELKMKNLNYNKEKSIKQNSISEVYIEVLNKEITEEKLNDLKDNLNNNYDRRYPNVIESCFGIPFLLVFVMSFAIYLSTLLFKEPSGLFVVIFMSVFTLFMLYYIIFYQEKKDKIEFIKKELFRNEEYLNKIITKKTLEIIDKIKNNDLNYENKESMIHFIIKENYLLENNKKSVFFKGIKKHIFNGIYNKVMLSSKKSKDNTLKEKLIFLRKKSEIE